MLLCMPCRSCMPCRLLLVSLLRCLGKLLLLWLWLRRMLPVLAMWHVRWYRGLTCRPIPSVLVRIVLCLWCLLLLTLRSLLLLVLLVLLVMGRL